MIPDVLNEIQGLLEKQSDPKAKASFQKFIPTSQSIYGVRVPFLNELAKQYNSGGLKLVVALWTSGAFEGKLLAAKILGRICEINPDETLMLLSQFSREISDWAVCDTLGTQGIRGIAKLKQKEIFDLAAGFVRSESLWRRRLGIVLLISFAKENEFKGEIQQIIQPLRGEKEHYIKKAIAWLHKELKK